ncbi:MAG: tetratricopeptide repeat protein [Promethearchaeota archaeon]
MKNSSEINQLIEKAISLRNQEKFQEALEILDELYKKFSNSEEVKNSLIKVLFDYGGYLNDYYTLGYEKAKQLFEKITQLSPNDYRAFYNLGIACFNLGQLENAITYLEKALKIKPDYKYCLYNLGLVYEDMENYEDALKFYEKALEIDPDFAYALAARSEMRKKLDSLKRMEIE